MRRRLIALAAGVTAASLWLIMMIGCGLAILPSHNWKCPYTYDLVTGCGKYGMPITSKGVDTETVQTPDRASACLAVSEYVHLDHPGRIHVICDPSKCEDLGPVAPMVKKMDFPLDGGFHVEDVDGGPVLDAGSDASVDPPVIVCDGGAAPPDCPAANPPSGALTDCIGCFVDFCCGVYAQQSANAKAADATDPQMQGLFQAQLLAEALAWMAAGTPAESGYPAPTPPLLPPSATFGACMVQKCLGICQQP